MMRRDHLSELIIGLTISCKVLNARDVAYMNVEGDLFRS